MAIKHPYVVSNKGLEGTIGQLRRSFPRAVTAATLQQLGFAPKSERLVIGVLKFLGVIDNLGSVTDAARATFLETEDAAFQSGFRALVQSSYSDLFELHGEDTWQLPRERLIQFFRSNDGASVITSERQAKTFSLLCQLSGFRPSTETKRPRTGATAAKTSPVKAKRVSAKPTPPAVTTTTSTASPPVGLTVRIELNLPADGSRETYDHIFKSIRENFLDG